MPTVTVDIDVFRGPYESTLFPNCEVLHTPRRAKNKAAVEQASSFYIFSR